MGGRQRGREVERGGGRESGMWRKRQGGREGRSEREGGREGERVIESERKRGSTVLSPPTLPHYQCLDL